MIQDSFSPILSSSIGLPINGFRGGSSAAVSEAAVSEAEVSAESVSAVAESVEEAYFTPPCPLPLVVNLHIIVRIDLNGDSAATKASVADLAVGLMMEVAVRSRS